MACLLQIERGLRSDQRADWCGDTHNDGQGEGQLATSVRHGSPGTRMTTRQPSRAKASVASAPHETSHVGDGCPFSTGYFAGSVHRQVSQPLSNTTFQLPLRSRRQIELKVATRSPFAFNTGPLLCAS